MVDYNLTEYISSYLGQYPARQIVDKCLYAGYSKEDIEQSFNEVIRQKKEREEQQSTPQMPIDYSESSSPLYNIQSPSDQNTGSYNPPSQERVNPQPKTGKGLIRSLKALFFGESQHVSEDKRVALFISLMSLAYSFIVTIVALLIIWNYVGECY